MGCFLGCFGLSCKRKRRKPANRVQPRHQLRICSYEPLDSASVNCGVVGETTSLDSELKEKSKEPFNRKVRKKVSFNLNVQTYEPIPKEESSDEESQQERPSAAAAAADFASYPPNYRYRNCVDCYDDEEEDEIAYDESDLDCEDEYDFEDDDEDFECMRTSREDEVTEKFESLSVNRDSLTENLNAEGVKLAGTTRNYRDRNQYVHSVLNPVENLSQWKAVKAKAMAPTKRQRKENVETPLISANSTSKRTPGLQEIAVDASLSNWLGSIEPCLLKSSCNSVAVV